MRVTSVGTDHLLCLSEEEVGLLVDLCHAGDFSEHIASSAERRERVRCLYVAGSAVPFADGSEAIRQKGAEANWCLRSDLLLTAFQVGVRSVLMTVQVLLAGTSTRAHKQRHSGQGKKQQALHRFLLGLESRVLTLSAVGDCLGDKGLNGLLDLTASA